MAEKTIHDLTELAAAPASDDELAIWDLSVSALKRITIANVFGGGTLSGGGVVATGGFTLTVPATMTAAGRNVTNTFTAAQTIAPTTSVDALTINMPSGSTARALVTQFNGSARIRTQETAIINLLQLMAVDAGTGSGPEVQIRRNENATTPAPGFLSCQEADADFASIYPDNSRVWRTRAGSPNNSNFASGDVIGSQSSQLATKDILGPGIRPQDALRTLLRTPVHHFRYKDGRYRNSDFHGIVAEESPDFVMDAGTVFNPVSAFGFTTQAIKALQAKIDELENKLSALLQTG